MMRHNWFPNPMLGDPKPTRSLDCSVNQWGSPDNPGIILRHSSDLIGGYAEWVVSGLPAGVKCAFVASCGAAEATDTFRGPLMEVQDSRSATLGRSENWANNRRLRVGLTVPSDGVVRSSSEAGPARTPRSIRSSAPRPAATNRSSPARPCP